MILRMKYINGLLNFCMAVNAFLTPGIFGNEQIKSVGDILKLPFVKLGSTKLVCYLQDKRG